jgi:GNAT superfamily N-acetyltransferase
MKPKILIRQMSAEDSDSVAELSGELGYPANAHDITGRFERLASSTERAVFVACLGEAVVGWIEVAIMHHLASATFGEINGLVVSAAHRGCGIGQLLVRRAEEWIASCGVRRVVVRSRTVRAEAHQFYLKNGYTEWKRQVAFSKEL